MAGDWIKVEKSTPLKPEVLAISEMLGIHPVHAFGLCVRFWMWCDDQISDGNARGVTKVTLDFAIGRDGMTDALVKVGWLRDRSGSLEVPHFDRHLSEGAKTRALTKERVRKSKVKCPGETVSKVTQTALPEKRREEKREEVHPLPPRAAPGAVPAVVEFIDGGPMDALKGRINGLRPEWQRPAQWNHSEDRLLVNGTAGQMDELTDDDWNLLREYLAAKIDPAEKGYWRPVNRSKFVETFPDVFTSARKWARECGREQPKKKPEGAWR